MYGRWVFREFEMESILDRVDKLSRVCPLEHIVMCPTMRKGIIIDYS